MFISSIRLKNFRCYKDQKIDFAVSGEKMLDLVIGDAGAGKTSLFNAIGWCLFGNETSTLLGEPEQDLGIPNVEAAQSGGTYEVSVELAVGGVGEGEEGQIIAKRTKRYKGNSVISPDLNGTFELSVFENGEPSQYDGKKAEDNLKEFFSSEFLEFYMFDGEYLAKGENIKGNNLDHAFKRMFKIGALKSLSQVLGELSMEYGNRRGNSGRLQQLQEDYKKEIDKLTQMKNEMEELNDDVDKLDGEIQGSKEKLDELKSTIVGIEIAKKKIDELNKIRDSAAELKKDINEARRAYWQSIINGAYLHLLREAMLKANNVVYEENRKADLPPYIKGPFLESIIRNRICICGRSLPEGGDELEKVKALKDAQDLDPYEAQMSEMGIVLSKIAGDHGPAIRIESASKMLEAKIKQENQLNGQIKSLVNESSELSIEQQETLENYRSEQGRISRMNEMLTMKKIKLSTLDKRIEEATKNLSDIDSKINKQASRNKEVEKAEKEKKIADIANEVVNDVASRLSSTFVNLLEEKLNNIIPEFQILYGITASIKIGGSKDLSVNILNTYLDPNRSYLSGGQNQTINILLIAAFTQALSEVSLSVPFIVMDHPFSNLSEERKIEAIEKFGSLFKNTRTLMLIPPGDFDISRESKLIGSAWRISNCKENKECKAEKEAM